MREYILFIQRIGLLGITKILIALSAIIILPILTKNISIEDYGIYVQINITSSLISSFATLGLPYTMVRYISPLKDKEKIKESFYSMLFLVLITSLAISILFYLLAEPISTFLFGGNVHIAQITAFIVFSTCLNTFLVTYFRTLQQMKRYSIYILFQTYLNLIIASYLALSGFEITIIALGMLFTQLVTLLIIIIIILMEIGFKTPKFENLREYLSFGIPTMPGNLSSWIVDGSDRYIISAFLGVAFVGYYNPGYTLAGIISMLLAPFAFLLPAVLPEHYDNDDIEKVNVYLKYSLKGFLLLAIPIGFGLSLLSKQLLSILTTPEIAAAGYMITPFICLSYIFFGIYGIIVNTLVLNYKTKLIAMTWFIAAILNLILCVALIPFIGILGAAISTLITYGLAFYIVLHYSSKEFKIDFNPKFILKCVLSSILMVVIIITTKPEGLFNILAIVIVCAGIYFISMFLLKGFEIEEIKLFKKMFKNN